MTWFERLKAAHIAFYGELASAHGDAGKSILRMV